MKKNIHFIAISLGLVLTGCSDKEEGDHFSDEWLSLDAVELSLSGTDMEQATRATLAGYVVNNLADPTNTLTGRETWELDVVIYDNVSNIPYTDGQGTFYWNAADQNWIMTPPDTIFFPNYFTPQATLELHPAGWTGVTDIALDQSAANGVDLLGQDVLIQNGDPTMPITPAHIIEADMKHAYSMLDFKLSRIDENQLGTVTVEVGGNTYVPYQITTGSEPEYLVIIPPGSTGPIVRLTTPEETRYFQATINQIANTGVNTCYCFTLVGLELSLGEITVAEWNTGQGIAGEYTSDASYPTFRGPANTEAIITYDTGVVQFLNFNEQGEATARPLGRSIVRIQGERTPIQNLNPPLVLRDMSIDLTSYLIFD